MQTISGTGANHLGALFLSRFYEYNGEKKVYLSNPTWGKSVVFASCTQDLQNLYFLLHLANHFAIFRNVDIEPLEYPYYDPQTIGLAFNPLLETLQSLPPRSVILLHACAHNPTGVDPTQEQWGQICDIFLQKGHYAFFDCAYQGFASGDLDRDAWAVREFVRREVPLLVCQVRVFLYFSLVLPCAPPSLLRSHRVSRAVDELMPRSPGMAET